MLPPRYKRKIIIEAYSYAPLTPKLVFGMMQGFRSSILQASLESPLRDVSLNLFDVEAQEELSDHFNPKEIFPNWGRK
jgi:hypothetical protein